MTRRNARRAVTSHRQQTERPLVDLSDHLDIDTFDQTIRAIESVIEDSQGLSLDDAGDRRVLRDRLWRAIGVEE